jgi:hypothetical protein
LMMLLAPTSSLDIIDIDCCPTGRAKRVLTAKIHERDPVVRDTHGM